MSLAAISIALSGANAAVRRLENSAANVANVSTTGTVPDGTGASTAGPAPSRSRTAKRPCAARARASRSRSS